MMQSRFLWKHLWGGQNKWGGQIIWWTREKRHSFQIHVIITHCWELTYIRAFSQELKISQEVQCLMILWLPIRGTQGTKSDIQYPTNTYTISCKRNRTEEPLFWSWEYYGSLKTKYTGYHMFCLHLGSLIQCLNKITFTKLRKAMYVFWIPRFCRCLKIL